MKALIILIGIICTSLNAQKFSASGSDSSENNKGEIVVNFAKLDGSKLTFSLYEPFKIHTDTGVVYTNGSTEIAIGDFAEENKYNAGNDKQREYSRVWIESQNEARIVVRHRAALVNKGGEIAYSNKAKIAPYGPGSWVDEWYVIHPDGTHTRRVKLYSEATHLRDPYLNFGKGGFRFENMALWRGAPKPGISVADDINEDALSLISMDGKISKINFEKPLLFMQSKPADIVKAFGKGRHSNIQLINTVSKYKPYRIGREPVKDPKGFDGMNVLSIPFQPGHAQKNRLPAYPRGATKESGYSVAFIGHMSYSDFWKKDMVSVNEIWLNGYTDSKTPEKELPLIAKSWLNSPTLTTLGTRGVKILGYNMGERAYVVENDPQKSKNSIALRFAASPKSPIYNPMLLINNWGDKPVSVLRDNQALIKGEEYTYGYYKEIRLDDGKRLHNVLALWVKAKAEKYLNLDIRGKASKAPLDSEPRTWTDVKGKKAEAKLINANDSIVLLQLINGKTLKVKRSLLSPEDQQYLKSKLLK